MATEYIKGNVLKSLDSYPIQIPYTNNLQGTIIRNATVTFTLEDSNGVVLNNAIADINLNIITTGSYAANVWTLGDVGTTTETGDFDVVLQQDNIKDLIVVADLDFTNEELEENKIDNTRKFQFDGVAFSEITDKVLTEVTTQLNNKILAVHKPADESRASTTTKAIDSDLQVQVEANSSYSLKLYLRAEGVSTGIINGFVGPAGVTGFYNDTYYGAEYPLTGTLPTISSSARTYQIIGNVNTVSAGTFGFEWAQAGSNVTASIVKQDSWMELIKLD